MFLELFFVPISIVTDTSLNNTAFIDTHANLSSQ